MKDSNTELPQSVTITVNGVDIKCYRDGSVEKIHGRSGKLIRTFGTNRRDRYKQVSIKGKKFLVHRLICQAFGENWEPNFWVDHISGVKNDNRPENLRQLETRSEHNKAHQDKRPGCSSKYRFVSWDKKSKKWRMQVKANGKNIYGGLFDGEIEAARAGDALAESLGFDEEAFNRTKHPEV